jgi:hypothetical protein
MCTRVHYHLSQLTNRPKRTNLAGFRDPVGWAGGIFLSTRVVLEADRNEPETAERGRDECRGIRRRSPCCFANCESDSTLLEKRQPSVLGAPVWACARVGRSLLFPDLVPGVLPKNTQCYRVPNVRGDVFWVQPYLSPPTAAPSASPAAARLLRLPCASWVSRAPLICRMPGYTPYSTTSLQW